MQRGLKLRNSKTAKLQIPQRGYMLITLMLALALVTIALLAVLPAMKQQIQRDREAEMVHRGTAYMRAIQHFYKKVGRYPASIEELENTNHVRYLRKRYTDPMTRDPKTGKEKDFKLLHQQDIALNNGPVLPGQSGPGGLSSPGGLGGATQGGVSGMQSGLGGLGAQSGALQQTSSANGETATSGGSGNSSSGSSNTSGSSNSNAGSNSSSGFNGPTFGGGPILGVASTNKKDKTIRVFFDKTHYSDWLFIYVSQLDRGGLLVGPVNPNMPPPANLNGLAPGQPGAGIPGQGPGGQAFGGSSFGGSSFGGPGQGGTQNNGGQTPPPQQNSGQTPPQQ